MAMDMKVGKLKKFDGILCAAAAPLVPKKLKQQLNIEQS